MSSASTAHYAFWPPGVPRHIAVPDESLWVPLERQARADRAGLAIDFLGAQSSWGDLHRDALALAASLQALGLESGGRVLMFMQNCPQYVVAFYAIVRCGGVVVPVNPMSKADELEHYLVDSEARIALSARDIAGQLCAAHEKLGARSGLRHLVSFDYADALPEARLDAPQEAPNGASRDASPDAAVEVQADWTRVVWPQAWNAWLATRHPVPRATGIESHDMSTLLTNCTTPAEVRSSGKDLVLLPYTSGTTGHPKGCMHTHASLMHNAMANVPWLDLRAQDRVMVVVPLFHITGLVVGMLASVQAGASIALLPRWDRRLAAQTIARCRVTHWPNIPTMVIDLLGEDSLDNRDFESLRYIGGGGAPMPEAVAVQLRERTGLTYVEGYGLTETAAPSHTNPRQAPRRACLGIPFISTRSCVVDPDTLAPMPVGEVGEILISGPQVFQGYWRQTQATAAAFVELDGERYFRTGDLGRVDAEGYFHIADRLKRMINASGFKVWPAEVESLFHRHPAIQEACIVAIRDPYRGESPKAVIVLRASSRGKVSAEEIQAWAREHMAAYKVPRVVELADELPKSASGKVLWKVVQARTDEDVDAASRKSTDGRS